MRLPEKMNLMFGTFVSVSIGVMLIGAFGALATDSVRLNAVRHLAMLIAVVFVVVVMMYSLFKLRIEIRAVNTHLSKESSKHTLNPTTIKDCKDADASPRASMKASSQPGGNSPTTYRNVRNPTVINDLPTTPGTTNPPPEKVYNDQRASEKFRGMQREGKLEPC
mmetsp:Transcript_6021/g.12074  ORF Transcript_6021/g.12074 Transcript_6021/m.12074 type:complete len:165 (+) Transcript_6021:960-1454(+)